MRADEQQGRDEDGTVSSPTRDDFPDTVTPGGAPAPLGARGAGTAAAHAESQGASTRRLPLAGAPRMVAAMLALALAAYAAIATAVVEGGWIVSLDLDVSAWVARSMPAWAEWLARPFTWAGGTVGMAVVVTAAVAWLFRRRERAAGLLLVVVAVGSQLLTTTAKEGYDRPRPTAGSPIDLPTSFSFPSGHAANGIAVLGLLGLLVAQRLPTRRARVATAAAGFAVGALVGASRLVLDVHFLSDVLAGAALGLAWLTTCLLAAGLVSRAPHR